MDEKLVVSCNCGFMIGLVSLLQDDSAMESLPTVPSRTAPHQFGPGGHGPQIHHRPHLQRLHFCVWVWHLHTPLPGGSKTKPSFKPVTSNQFHTFTMLVPYNRLQQALNCSWIFQHFFNLWIKFVFFTRVFQCSQI